MSKPGGPPPTVKAPVIACAILVVSLLAVAECCAYTTAEFAALVDARIPPGSYHLDWVCRFCGTVETTSPPRAKVVEKIAAAVLRWPERYTDEEADAELAAVTLETMFERVVRWHLSTKGLRLHACDTNTRGALMFRNLRREAP